MRVRKSAVMAGMSVFWAIALAACGFGGNNGSSGSDANPSGKTEEMTENSGNQDSVGEQSYGEGLPEENGEPPETLENGEYARWILYETEEYSVVLTETVDLEDGYSAFSLDEVNNSQYMVNFAIRDFTLNGTVHMAVNEDNLVEPYSSSTEEFKELNSWLAMFGGEVGEIRELCFDVMLSYQDPANYYEQVILGEKKCRIVFPEGYHPSIVFEPVYSMKADRQVLFENEDLLIELYGLGHLPDYFDMNAFTVVVSVENRTDHLIPAEFSGIMVNGYYFDMSFWAKGDGILLPGTKGLLMSTLEKDELEAAGIREISSIQLLLMTSEEENTGAYMNEGGSWYPVVLSESGDASEEEEDLLVYEDEYVQVFFRESYMTWDEEFYNGPVGEFHWVFIVNNKSRENLEFVLDEVQFDGYADGKDPYEGSSAQPTKLDLGAGAKLYLDLGKRTRKNLPLPELSFLVRVRTLGGGTLLHSAKEPVVIKASGQE